MTVIEADIYEPGENLNPKDSGYLVRREWHCQPPAMTEQFYITEQSGWIWEPETNTYVRQVFAWASEGVPTPSPEPPADYYPPERMPTELHAQTGKLDEGRRSNGSAEIS